MLIVALVLLMTPSATPRPNGPYRVVGRQILDRDERPYLIRGTSLAPLGRDETKPGQFGAHSATTLITIRQRLNMNAVRVPLEADSFVASAAYRERTARLVGLVNRMQLLPILEADSQASEQFWRMVGECFRSNPNVFFATVSARFSRALRESGAAQPVLVSDVLSPDAIFESAPHYRDVNRVVSKAGDLATLVKGLDPDLDRIAGECVSVPGDPAELTNAIEAVLAMLDRRQVSWTISSFTPGKLITDYRSFNGTKLDPGWRCGERQNGETPGIGLLLLSHLWKTNPLKLFVVSDSRGGLELARGGIATAYGPILADEAAHANGAPLPKHLSNISIRVTDSKGVARLAPMLYTGAGWGFASFIVPDLCAEGPAEVAVMRADGSMTRSNVVIKEVAPALFTSPPDGRSFGNAFVTQRVAGKFIRNFPAWKCGESGCQANPIALSPAVATTLRLVGSGFRHAGPRPVIRASVGNVDVPVVSRRVSAIPGNDELTVSLPDLLCDAGEVDLYFTVDGELSNVVRVKLGK